MNIKGVVSMPTYVTIEFIRDFVQSSIKRKEGRSVISWKTIHSVGDKMRLTFDKAHEYIKNGYAKYVH